VLLAAATALAGCGASQSAELGSQGPAAQFVVECELSHLAFDDPLVLPWQPGKSHLHMFFGNRAVDADPGYDDQILAAGTSCDDRRDTASYWAPALLDSEGKVVEPIDMVAYHRSGQGVDPSAVVPYPPGLMLIGGDAASRETQSTDIVGWSCGSDVVRSDRPTQCSDDSTLRMVVTFPDCWDGERLSTFGASAHVRYSDASIEGGCPDDHPVALPQLTIGIDFPPIDPAGLSLSSGGIDTAHADFWNVWDQAELDRQVEDCINGDQVCE